MLSFGMEALVASSLVSHRSTTAADTAAVPSAVSIGAVALVTPRTTPTTTTAVFVVVHVHTSSFRTDRHRQALDDRSLGVAGWVHAVIDRKVAANQVGTHGSVLTG